MRLAKLGDLAQIQIGLVLARKAADKPSAYVYRRLLLGALREDGINPRETEPFESSGPLEKSYMTQAGSIVIKLSAPFNPCLVTQEAEGLIIPSQMAVIKIHGDMLPEYICFYLAQEHIARHLMSDTTGIAQRAITISVLANLEIGVPSKKNQKLICDFYKTICMKRQLRNELDKQEQEMMKYVFSRLTKETKEVQL
jgi:hypothetical protein